MTLHDYQCRRCDAIFEQMVEWDQSVIGCKCGGKADRTFLSRGDRRQLANPIVLHKYADGSYGVPGATSDRTPVGAERIEIRSMAEYDRTLRKMNDHERSMASRKHDQVQEARESLIAEGRGKLAHRMANESNPMYKDLYRAALEREPTAHRELAYRPFMAEAMEMNASNRESYWDRETGMRGRK